MDGGELSNGHVERRTTSPPTLVEIGQDQATAKEPQDSPSDSRALLCIMS